MKKILGPEGIWFNFQFPSFQETLQETMGTSFNVLKLHRFDNKKLFTSRLFWADFLGAIMYCTLCNHVWYSSFQKIYGCENLLISKQKCLLLSVSRFWNEPKLENYHNLSTKWRNTHSLNTLCMVKIGQQNVFS